jgi:hypothetical protein
MNTALRRRQEPDRALDARDSTLVVFAVRAEIPGVARGSRAFETLRARAISPDHHENASTRIFRVAMQSARQNPP